MRGSHDLRAGCLPYPLSREDSRLPSLRKLPRVGRQVHVRGLLTLDSLRLFLRFHLVRDDRGVRLRRCRGVPVTQLELYIDKALEHPIAANLDPVTSFQAAKEITASGKRHGQLIGVLALVKLYPRSTSLELSRHSGFDRYVIARRLPELASAGLVVRRDARLCMVGNRPAVTWEAI